METINTGTCTPKASGWLDRVAILMAFVCGVHCLATPLLLVILPMIGQTFWTDSNFHFWMLLFVIPTTALAVFSGCRKHKDRLVATFATIGLCFLVSAVVVEGASLGMADDGTVAANTCSACASCSPASVDSEGNVQISSVLPNLTKGSFLSLMGGLFLIAGHLRNFRLCRAKRCCEGRV
ncbi:MerC domain-containing protein [Puniceicoccaceae bacterium K14]|nr:MerC domain-containing protein [Puniceicoccaceae bacterium K14]